jgi:hypothetical protein
MHIFQTDSNDTNLASDQDIFERLHATSSLPEALPQQLSQAGLEKTALPRVSQNPDVATFYETRRSSPAARPHCHDQGPERGLDTLNCLAELRRFNSSKNSLPMQFLFEPLHRLYSAFFPACPTTAKKKRGRNTKLRPKSRSGCLGPASVFWILISTISLLLTSTTAIGKSEIFELFHDIRKLMMGRRRTVPYWAH